MRRQDHFEFLFIRLENKGSPRFLLCFFFQNQSSSSQWFIHHDIANASAYHHLRVPPFSPVFIFICHMEGNPCKIDASKAFHLAIRAAPFHSPHLFYFFLSSI